MTRLHGFVFSAFLMVTTGGALHAQSSVTAPQVAANATGIAGQPGRGITAVTRRTPMVVPGQQANGFFAAGGVNVAAPVPVVGAVPTAPAPGIVANSPGLQRPDVQAALQRLAVSGNVEARQLLKQPTSGASTATVAPSR